MKIFVCIGRDETVPLMDDDGINIIIHTVLACTFHFTSIVACRSFRHVFLCHHTYSRTWVYTDTTTHVFTLRIMYTKTYKHILYIHLYISIYIRLSWAWGRLQNNYSLKMALCTVTGWVCLQKGVERGRPVHGSRVFHHVSLPLFLYRSKASSSALWTERS